MRIFSIKKRYLFPLIYLALLAVAIILRSDGIAMLLFLPSSLPLLFVEVQLGMKRTLTGGGFFFPVIIGAVPYIVLGLVWDWVASYFRNKSFSGD